jgi:hypothetical protein
MSAFDRLERFVERLPQGSIDDAISVFYTRALASPRGVSGSRA